MALAGRVDEVIPTDFALRDWPKFSLKNPAKRAILFPSTFFSSLLPMITYRPLTLTDLPAAARIHVDGWRSAYQHFIPAEVLAGQDPAADEAEFHQWLTEWNPPAFGFVAELDGQLVGFSLAGKNFEEPDGYSGELYKLFVRPECHGQGIGRRLLRLTAEALGQAGFPNLVIWCFREGDSAGFYARLGLPVVHTTAMTLGGRPCDVLVFGGAVDALLASLADPQP